MSTGAQRKFVHLFFFFLVLKLFFFVPFNGFLSAEQIEAMIAPDKNFPVVFHHIIKLIMLQNQQKEAFIDGEEGSDPEFKLMTHSGCCCCCMLFVFSLINCATLTKYSGFITDAGAI